MVAARFGHFRLSFSDAHSRRKSFPASPVCRPLSCLNQARSASAGAPRRGMACYDTALQYAKTRKQFPTALASHNSSRKNRLDDHRNRKGQLLALHVGR